MIRKQYRRANVYTIGQVADEIISSIVRTKQEWKSPRYLSLPFKTVMEKKVSSYYEQRSSERYHKIQN